MKWGMRNSGLSGLSNPPNDQRAVLRSKSNAVAERGAHVSYARFQGSVIQITIRIGIVEIYLRRHHARRQGAQRRALARSPTRALRMANLRFSRGHPNAMR